MEQNICHFIPYHKDVHPIHTIHFVLETKPQPFTHLKTESVYKMYYVQSGTGWLHTPGKKNPLKKGDIFFTFPAFPFDIESQNDFQYMYISFVGLRGNQIMENLKISHSNFLFHDGEAIQDFWEKGIKASDLVADWISESILLYTFSFLGEQLLSKKDESNQSHCVNLIKKYVDDHFTEQKFSLDAMSLELSYNKKYLSYIFKKNLGIGIIEYLNTIRIQNACTLMEQGFTGVTHIADCCGFSDVQYFSKVFKGKTGVAPTQYIKGIQRKENPDE